MTDDDDLEPRVSALENQVRDLAGRVRGSEQDSAAARILAGAADRDVGEIRGEIRDLRAEFRDFRTATTASFNAQRQDFVDLRQDFLELRNEFDRGFAEMRGKFDGTAAGLAHLAELLQTVIDNQGRSA